MLGIFTLMVKLSRFHLFSLFRLCLLSFKQNGKVPCSLPCSDESFTCFLSFFYFRFFFCFAETGAVQNSCRNGDDVLIKYLPLVLVLRSFLVWCTLDRWQGWPDHLLAVLVDTVLLHPWEVTAKYTQKIITWKSIMKHHQGNDDDDDDDGKGSRWKLPPRNNIARNV